LSQAGYGWPMVGGDMSQQGTEGDYNNKRPDLRRPPPTKDNKVITEPEKEANFQLDAAQRKKLPIWIREGLEKMEREKQKKLEKERMMVEKEETLRRKREEEAQARQILEEDMANDGKARVPRKSKFDSDSEGEGHSRSGSPESSTPGLGSLAARKRRSRFDAVPSATRLQKKPSSEGEIKAVVEDDDDSGGGRDDNDGEPMPAPEPLQTEEDRMREMMVKLRRWMTEILLDVTTDMMGEIAGEVINRARMRAPPVQVKKSSGALASLSGGIGLGIYSDSESDGEASVGPGGDGVDGETDSDEELRETIRKKRKGFQATERSILQKLQNEEMAERRKQQGEASESEKEEEDIDGKRVDEGGEEVGIGEEEGLQERLGLGMKESETRGGKGSQNKDASQSAATVEKEGIKQSKSGET